jgi:hypothetical protein
MTIGTSATCMLGGNAPEIARCAKVPEFRRCTGHGPCAFGRRQEGVMSHVIARRQILDFVVGLVEHVFFVIAGFVLMVVGVGLSVTMIMLPVGLALGLLGFAMFVGGLTVRMNR